MFRISAPGIYYDVPVADYYNDCCPAPSLTQSAVAPLLTRSPRHVWWNSPRLNPYYEEQDEPKFDVGTVAHRVLIGRGKDIAIIKADDYRTKLAQAAREAALKEGKTPILEHQHTRVVAMVEAVRIQLDGGGYGRAFKPKHGAGEVMIAWQDGGVWCRSLIDWLEEDARTTWDLKTTRASAAPKDLPKRMIEGHWEIQGALQERGLDVLDPENAGRRKHRVVCVECDLPHSLTVTEIPEAALVMGRKQVERAIGMWRECLKVGWPGYSLELQRPEYPSWAEAKILERELEEEAA